MATFLLLYGTGEGQTARVAARIGEELTARGHEVTVVDAADPPADLSVSDFDAVLVGASIHVGRHQKSVREFVRGARDDLATRPTAFFQVSLTSAEDTEEARAEAAGYVDEFVEATGWHPDRVGLFGGALRYSEYGFLKRLVMKQIAKQTRPDADTDHDVEFTDWHEVDAFTADVAAFVEGRLGTATPAGRTEE